MSMAYKHATGTRVKDNTRSGDSGVQYGYVGEYQYEIPNTEPTTGTETRADLRSTKGKYDRPYAHWKVHSKYGTNRMQNVGGSGGANCTCWKWYRHDCVWKLRKIAKRAATQLYGVAPDAVNTKLWAA